MPLIKLPKLLGKLLRFPKSSQPQQKTTTAGTVHLPSSSSAPPPLPSFPPSQPLHSSTGTSTNTVSYRIPIEVIERILFYVFPLSTDPTRSSTFPSPPPHPLSLLLASKGLYHLVLPYFYQSIRVLRGQDWVTLFHPKDGILGARELGMGRASYDDRRSWVKELFVRGEEHVFTWIPWDLKGAKQKRLGREEFCIADPSFLQLQTLGPPLPHLRSLFLLPYFDPSPSPAVLEIFKFLRFDRIWGMKSLVGGDYRDDLLDVVSSYAFHVQNKSFQEISLLRPSTSAFLHHPLILRPQNLNWMPRVYPDEDVTWIVDCSGMDETLLGEALKESIRWEAGCWEDPVPYLVPWYTSLAVWTGVEGPRMRACARCWAAEIQFFREERKPGWKFVMKDGSTRLFFDEELEEDRDL